MCPEGMRVKTPAQSQAEMTELVLPNDANLLGNLLGGRMMHWMDLAGAVAASRHSNAVVATVSMDKVDFRHPVRVGEVIYLKAKVIWVGNTSMVVKVMAFAENLQSGNCIKSNEAYMTFVALDQQHKPTPVPRLLPQTEEEREDFLMIEKQKE